ncbi:MAG TPA: right-handed parallel beta-helix repeat-containing protein [Gemmataceae bacterium]|nr:right-handed parallel beta-helix repeat-containing protein [Gemmataceae bacterium]
MARFFASTWLKAATQTLNGLAKEGRRGRRMPPAWCRPRLEVLEDRTLLSHRTLGALIQVAPFGLYAGSSIAGPSPSVHSVRSQADPVDMVENSNDTGSGSLRDTIANAAAGDTITFDLSAGHVTSPITLTSAVLDITKNLTIDGPGANILAISGNGNSGVFTVDPGTTATIAGLTLTKGLSLTGGAIMNSGTLTLTNCTVSNSTAIDGGGVDNQLTLIMTNCTIANNVASGFGGGIFNDGSLTLTNSTIADNLAASSGGGMYISSGSSSLYNATVALNQDGVDQVGGTVNTYNSLFADNTGNDFTSSGGTATATNSQFGSVPTGVINGGGSFIGASGLDPAGLANNGGPTQTIALTAGSLAIGAGQNPINGVTLSTDQRGYVPTAGVWDIGAFQFGAVPAAAPTATLSAQNVAVADYGKTTYTFTVTYTSATKILAASLSGAVVQVGPPGGVGAPINASVVSTVPIGPTDASGNAQSFTVTYQITPPGGKWTSADNGTYSVNLGGSPVTDLAGTPVATGTLGTFAVETGKIAINKYGLIHNPKTGLWSGMINLTNAGSSAFSGPIFVLFNLPPGVILENAAGTYGGMPYLEVNIASLAAGKTTGATAVFNSNVAPGSYTTSYYLGSLGS